MVTGIDRSGALARTRTADRIARARSVGGTALSPAVRLLFRAGRSPWTRLVLLAGLLASSSLAVLPALAGGVRVAGPAIALDPPIHDFGMLPQEGIFYADIRITNRGTAPLQVHKIASDCGCTVADLSDSTLTPGESTSLRVAFNTHSFSGQVRKNVFVETNDPGMPRATVGIKAFVRPWIRMDREELDFGAVPRGTPSVQTVRLYSAASDQVRIVKLGYPEELMEAEYDQSSLGDSLVHTVRFRLRADAPAGAFTKPGLVETTHPQSGALRLKLTGQIHGFFRLDAPSVSFGQMKQGTARMRELRLTATGSGSCRVQSATCADERVRVEIVPQTGRDYLIRLTVPASTPAGKLKGKLVILTDDPIQPRIEVPVVGRIRSPSAPEEPERFEGGAPEEEP